jgi:soluble lytic murein transglycosylase-like protein
VEYARGPDAPRRNVSTLAALKRWGRLAFRLFWRLTWWQRLTMVAAAPVLSINLAVAFFGSSAVFPFSPFFLSEKCTALSFYGRHRVGCLFRGHAELPQIIAAAERSEGLPRGLMRAVVEVESDNRVHRISFAGAMGPAQLMPATCASLGVGDPFDPAESITAGARYLAAQLRRTRSVKLAVASYNAGPGNVSGTVPQNGQTEFYVERVMRRFNARE